MPPAPGGSQTPKGKARLKEIVDEHLHREGLSPADLEVEVANRSSASGRRTIAGSELAGAGGGFIDLKDGGRIPMHKVERVRSRGVVVWARPGSID